MSFIKKILLMISVIQVSMAVEYTREMPIKIKKMHAKQTEDIYISFAQQTSPNLFLKNISAGGKKTYNLFDFGCEGIKYTGAVEQALIDEILKIKKEIKAMMDPITKLSKLDAILFAYGLVKCTGEEIKCHMTGTCKDEISGEEVNKGNNLKTGMLSKALAAANNKLILLVNGQINTTGGMSGGGDIETQSDTSGVLKDIWTGMDENDTWKEIVTCIMKVREKAFLTIYEWLNRSYKMELDFKTITAGSCNYQLIRGDEEEMTFNELLDSFDEMPSGGNNIEEDSNVDMTDEEIGKNIDNAVKQTNVDNYESENYKYTKSTPTIGDLKNDTSTITEDEIKEFELGEYSEECTEPTNNNGESFYSQSCIGTLTSGQEVTYDKTIKVENKIKQEEPKAIAKQKVNGADSTNNSITKTAKSNKTVYSKTGYDTPGLSKEEQVISKKLLGNTSKIQQDKFIYKEGELSIEEINQELKGVGLLYKPNTSISTYVPSFTAVFFKNLDFYNSEEKKEMTNYFFRKIGMFENSIEIKMFDDNEEKNRWTISRNLNNEDDYEVRFNMTTSSDNKMMSRTYLNNIYLKNADKMWFPDNNFTEIITALYISKCNSSKSEITDVTELIKIANYYNSEYVYKIGLNRQNYIFDMGIGENNMYTKYKKVTYKEDRQFDWINNTHLEYLVFRKNERYSLISMLVGFKCTLSEHKQLIKDSLAIATGTGTTGTNAYNIWTEYSDPTKQTDQQKIQLSFSERINILPKSGNNLYFNNKIMYYNTLNHVDKSKKKKYKLILKELERGIIDAYSLEEKIGDFNERKSDKKAEIEGIRLKNDRGSMIEKKIEKEKMEYLDQMSIYFK